MWRSQSVEQDVWRRDVREWYKEKYRFEKWNHWIRLKAFEWLIYHIKIAVEVSMFECALTPFNVLVGKKSESWEWLWSSMPGRSLLRFTSTRLCWWPRLNHQACMHTPGSTIPALNHTHTHTFTHTHVIRRWKMSNRHVTCRIYKELDARINHCVSEQVSDLLVVTTQGGAMHIFIRFTVNEA